MRRRSLLELGLRAGAAAIAAGCLPDVHSFNTSGPSPSAPTPETTWVDVSGVCTRANAFTGDGVRVWAHPWPRGFDAGALVSVDDFCPVFLRDDSLDFGGDLSPDGVLRGFLVDEVLKKGPAMISLMTIANMNQHPLSGTPLGRDDKYRLSNQGDWVRLVEGLIAEYPLRVGMHGYTHFNERERSPREFHQYDENATIAALNAMVHELRRAFASVEPAFRAPGWDATPAVLRYMAKSGIVLADSSVTPTFNGPLASCFSADSSAVIREGPDFDIGILAAGETGSYIIRHFHFTAPNPNSLGLAEVRKALTEFVRLINAQQTYRFGWFSYLDAARHMAAARTLQWKATLEPGLLRISLEKRSIIGPGVSLAVTGLAAREVLVEDEGGAPVSFSAVPSARGCTYIVLTLR